MTEDDVRRIVREEVSKALQNAAPVIVNMARGGAAMDARVRRRIHA